MEEIDARPEVENSSDEQLFLAISNEAVSGGEAKRSMQLMGLMQNVDVHILIDSGSTNSFISQKTVDKLANLNLSGACSSQGGRWKYHATFICCP